MSLNIYLTMNGTSEAAMNFYKEATNGTIHHIMRFGEQNPEASATEKDQVMHGSMEIHGNTVMFSDGGDKHQATVGDNFSLSLDYKSKEDLEREFAALSAGGSVTMPPQDTFWGAYFAMCKDKFGVNWMFNYDRPKA